MLAPLVKDFALADACLPVSQTRASLRLLSELYGEPEGPERFAHPEYGRPFEYMNDRQAVQLARKVTDKIIASGYKRVVVMESGAVPLGEMCRKIAGREGVKLEWDWIKIPRSLENNLAGLFESHLLPQEREQMLTVLQQASLEECLGRKLPAKLRRIEGLKLLCASIPESELDLGKTLPEKMGRIGAVRPSAWREACLDLLSGTVLIKRFDEPFLLLDEYVTSGTVMANAQVFFNLISPALHYQVGCYLLNLDRHAGCGRSVSFALYDRSEQLQCFAAGAYPYENRVDLIGFFYTTQEGKCRKVNLEEFCRGNPAPPELPAVLLERLEQSRLLEYLMEHCAIPEVAQNISTGDLLRFALCRLEVRAAGGKNTGAEFLSQLFEMYGPPWYPLPITFHKEFLRIFEKVTPLIDMLLTPELVSTYLEERQGILSAIAKLCLERRKVWERRINHILEEDL